MKRTTEMVTRTDYQRLSSMLDQNPRSSPGSDILEEKLARVSVIDPEAAPADLVTMNTKVRGLVRPVDGSSDHEDRTWTLVYPRFSDISKGMISVFAPLGAQLLGVRVGEEIAWSGLDGVERSVIVEEVLYQPEASGDWHL